MLHNAAATAIHTCIAETDFGIFNLSYHWIAPTTRAPLKPQTRCVSWVWLDSEGTKRQRRQTCIVSPYLSKQTMQCITMYFTGSARKCIL